MKSLTVCHRLHKTGMALAPIGGNRLTRSSSLFFSSFFLLTLPLAASFLPVGGTASWSIRSPTAPPFSLGSGAMLAAAKRKSGNRTLAMNLILIETPPPQLLNQCPQSPALHSICLWFSASLLTQRYSDFPDVCRSIQVLIDVSDTSTRVLNVPGSGRSNTQTRC